jgi:hypothetical protein
MTFDIAQCPTQYEYDKSTFVIKLQRMSYVEFLILYCHNCYYIPSFRLSIVLNLN